MGREGRAEMKADTATLEQCRRNPAAAAQDGLVTCLECGLLVRRFTRSPNCHARRVHKLDASAYPAKWPGAPLAGAEAEQAERDAHELYKETHRDELKAQRREYRQRPEIKAKENEYRRERWLKWYAAHREKGSQRKNPACKISRVGKRTRTSTVQARPADTPSEEP
jgi:hypothetical protein